MLFISVELEFVFAEKSEEAGATFGSIVGVSVAMLGSEGAAGAGARFSAAGVGATLGSIVGVSAAGDMPASLSCILVIIIDFISSMFAPIILSA